MNSVKEVENCKFAYHMSAETLCGVKPGFHASHATMSTASTIFSLLAGLSAHFADLCAAAVSKKMGSNPKQKCVLYAVDRMLDILSFPLPTRNPRSDEKISVSEMKNYLP